LRKVLMVAYQFPPMGGSGVQRTVKFAKYLDGFGWMPVVFTRKTGSMEVTDHSLVNDIPPHVTIIRSTAYDFTNLPGLMKLPGKFIGRKILIPDSERLWQIAGVKAVSEAVKSLNIDLLYTTSYPYSDHLMGLAIKKRFPDLPWIADFRDEWINNPYLKDKPHWRLRMNIEKKMEKQVLDRADRLITNTPVMMENFITLSGADREKFSVIPNGYDEDDFKDMDRGHRHNARFTMTYTGALYGRRHPGTFFKALSELISQGIVKHDDIAVRFIGHYKTAVLQAEVDRFGLGNVVEILPYMQHRQCLEKLVESDALLLIEGSGPGGEAFYTGKVFEYMASGRPILAVIPENGAAAGLIRETRTGVVCDFQKHTDIVKGLKKLYDEWKSGQSSYSPDVGKIKSYERKELTAKLVSVFNEAMKAVKENK
jgi:glycosyltransferase involved in cell wall biosynthesis